MKYFGKVEKVHVKNKKLLPWINVFWKVSEADRRMIKGKLALALTMGLRPDYDTIFRFDPFDGMVEQTVIALRDQMDSLPELDPIAIPYMEQFKCWNPLEDFKLALDKFIDIQYSMQEFKADTQSERDTVKEWKLIIDELNKDSEWEVIQ